MDTESEFPARRRRWLLRTLLAGQFMAQADVTVVNVAAPSIHAGLGASGTARQLVVGGYLIALAALTYPSSSTMATYAGMRMTASRRRERVKRSGNCRKPAGSAGSGVRSSGGRAGSAPGRYEQQAGQRRRTAAEATFPYAGARPSRTGGAPGPQGDSQPGQRDATRAGENVPADSRRLLAC